VHPAPLDPVRLLHVSDLHIEEPGDAESVAAVVALCAGIPAHLLLIAGDFFDRNRVSAATVAAVTDALGRCPAPVVVLPGNHDPCVPGSVYDRADLGPRVAVLRTPGGESVAFPELDLEVWGRPHASWEDFRPLTALPPRGAAFWQVAVAHGHLARGPADVARAYRIEPADIAACGRDHVALGHWDLPGDAGSGGVSAVYSGSPSRVGSAALTVLRRGPDGGREVATEWLRLPARR
jgi:DNA repair exonuclease SbcCD nuclease subunit